MSHLFIKCVSPRKVIADNGIPLFEETSMNNATNETFALDASAVDAFADILNDEGQMRAGFVIHESNNNISADIEDAGK
ncbi:hypothetical protein HX871_13395 [Pseudomonas reactans]|jgi:hypothetical protein|uniref:Uncharacterized protein n=2 Tax=Pseudomonas TaxID=286 RepID=A0ABX2QYD9_9PSED|nr:hypothetical protein [Pseudomonas reactans]NWC89588.1 hypothetical protein [Pseudomonas reactans]NWD28562.1 hypothetical protein [Pseudomonas reactans]NWD95418.1 hypothetical protein [Pseudomonas reactans]NWF17524.1 hypothetical protein [Pseudomonas reactans]